MSGKTEKSLTSAFLKVSIIGGQQMPSISFDFWHIIENPVLTYVLL